MPLKPQARNTLVIRPVIDMKTIEFLENFEFGKVSGSEAKKEIKKIFDGTRRQIISVTLRDGEILPKHNAREPITVFCLAGAGIFRAGENLEDEQPLTAGTLITLDAEIEHEVIAAPEVHILVTKFKDK